MIQESKIDDNALEVTYTFAAPLDKVYSAWAEADQMVQWMGPGEVKCDEVNIDLQVGGKYMIKMNTGDGIATAIGEYKEIEPNKKLVFTWHWLDGTFENSIVTLLFSETKEGTALNLNHTLLPDKEKTEHHAMGWNGCVAKLNDYLRA
jgi:uncharacterized protein YndB with AHSA1/START domain